MQITPLPLDDILISNRFRSEMGDLAGLADSISRHGQLLPIVINQEKRLVDGGRRLAACRLLNLPTVNTVYRETLSEDELHELEIEANKHKQFEWYEKVLGIAHIHKIKVQRQLKEENWEWSQKATGELLGVSTGHVNYCLQIAKRLTGPMAEQFRQCNNLADAWRLELRIHEDETRAYISQREKKQTNTSEQENRAKAVIAQVEAIEQRPDLLASERERYNSNKHNEIPFEVYWEECTKAAEEARNTIYISNKFICGDSIAYMNDPENEGRFDHLVTDIPYGIDMDMLNQQNPHGEMNDLDTVIEEHDVDENKDLITKFFPAAYRCTKDSAFVITWCDQMLWQFMYDLAIAAGFSVQRWPLTWVKTSRCMNQCAQYNFTKSTEIAMVCRKPKAIMLKTAPTCVVTASNEEIKRLTGHPFAKPHECWEFILDKISIEGQTILEPFAGRGSAILSMLRMKRNFIAVELQVAHYNALLENVKKEYYLKQNPKYVFK